jgi:hypothetical protein
MILCGIGGDDAAEEARDDRVERSDPGELDQIINMKHELVQLAGKIDWDWLDSEIAPLYCDKGRPGIRDAYRARAAAAQTIERGYVDKGYRGHDTANPRRIFISGQKRGVFGVIKRELRRRSAIEAVIGHMKTDGHLGRCYLKAASETLPTPTISSTS